MFFKLEIKILLFFKRFLVFNEMFENIFKRVIKIIFLNKMLFFKF